MKRTRIQIVFLAALAGTLTAGVSMSAPPATAVTVASVAQPERDPKAGDAKALPETLDPFYTQHVVVDGMPIVSSGKVSMYALRETEYLVRQMLANRPEVLAKLVEKKMYVCVMAYDEMQTCLPECRNMSPWWDKRARGLGGRPVSCAEENLLGFKGDPYEGENIFVHEFAHGIHGALCGLDKQFDERLRALYQKAKESGRFGGYGLNSHGEFWAEAVQSWFHCNRTGGLELLDPEGQVVCQLHTREQLREHLPDVAELIDDAFRGNTWVYVPVLERLDQPHLRGYEPARSPAFRWPPAVIEALQPYRGRTREEEERVPGAGGGKGGGEVIGPRKRRGSGKDR